MQIFGKTEFTSDKKDRETVTLQMDENRLQFNWQEKKYKKLINLALGDIGIDQAKIDGEPVWSATGHACCHWYVSS